MSERTEGATTGRRSALNAYQVAGLLDACARELRELPDARLGLQGAVALDVLKRVLRVVCRVVADIESPTTKRDD